MLMLSRKRTYIQTATYDPYMVAARDAEQDCHVTSSHNSGATIRKHSMIVINESIFS